jgi:hypothetical protein
MDTRGPRFEGAAIPTAGSTAARRDDTEEVKELMWRLCGASLYIRSLSRPNPPVVCRGFLTMFTLLPCHALRIECANASSKSLAKGDSISCYDLEQLVLARTRLSGPPFKFIRHETGKDKDVARSCTALFSSAPAQQACLAALDGLKTSVRDIGHVFSCREVPKSTADLCASLAAKQGLFARLAPGQRPDTLVLRSVPPRWFGLSAEQVEFGETLTSPTPSMQYLLEASALDPAPSSALRCVPLVSDSIAPPCRFESHSLVYDNFV